MVLAGLGGYARQVRPLMKTAVEQTGGARTVEVAQSNLAAWGGSGCGRSRHLKSKTKLLITMLAVQRRVPFACATYPLAEEALILGPALVTHAAGPVGLRCCCLVCPVCHGQH
jgi:hypothetical protein